MRLKDKITIVTGATHGIGKAIAEAFAQEGAWVLLAGRDEGAGESNAEAIRKAGGRAVYLKTDVGVKDDVIRAVERAKREDNGRIDVLVNNAAYLADWHNIVEASDEEWDTNYRVTMRGGANFIQQVMPGMVERRNGSIIIISSVQGMVAARSSPAYTAIKHGLMGLMKNVAYDYGPYNVRCNVIAPGAIKVRYSPQPGSELHTRQISKTFLGRVGEPHEISGAAVYLASDESSYVTGAIIPVDGGWTCM